MGVAHRCIVADKSPAVESQPRAPGGVPFLIRGLCVSHDPHPPVLRFSAGHSWARGGHRESQSAALHPTHT
ncbi:hypothetical protein AAFF_G00280050 [Aldrovandia affinis]|uniref:Uncharacterized protein n=1 Tax=Aldrovandia affinis TaxID=143900 RepID=A0AAD7W181_9TELE|nr:hypothetical protein AAFF_G00280050 [Aldrovandia affinis]